MPIIWLKMNIFLSTRLVVIFFAVFGRNIHLSKVSHQKDSNCRASTEDLSTTVKSDNTLGDECRTEIYLAAVPCNGMKMELPLYFAVVILLIILTGTAQTETLLNSSPHLRKAASKTGLRSWKCDNNKKKKKTSIEQSIAYLFCSLEL